MSGWCPRNHLSRCCLDVFALAYKDPGSILRLHRETMEKTLYFETLRTCVRAVPSKAETYCV